MLVLRASRINNLCMVINDMDIKRGTGVLRMEFGQRTRWVKIGNDGFPVLCKSDSNATLMYFEQAKALIAACPKFFTVRTVWFPKGNN